MKYWIHQCRPDKFIGIENSVKEFGKYRKPDWYNVPDQKHYDEMKERNDDVAGDILLVWKAQGNKGKWRGIIAKAEIINKHGTVRANDKDWPSQVPDKNDQEKIGKGESIDVRYFNTYINDPLKYEELVAEFPDRNDWPLVMRKPRGTTTCEITPEQYQRIDLLLSRHKPD